MMRDNNDPFYAHIEEISKGYMEIARVVIDGCKEIAQAGIKAQGNDYTLGRIIEVCEQVEDQNLFYEDEGEHDPNDYGSFRDASLTINDMAIAEMEEPRKGNDPYLLGIAQITRVLEI